MESEIVAYLSDQDIIFIFDILCSSFKLKNFSFIQLGAQRR
jgi:hypothetical protein